MAALGSSLELNTFTNLSWIKGQTELSKDSPFLQLIGTWILLLTNFVPISLVVSLELVKLWQAMFMQYDMSMYDEEQDMNMWA